MKKEGSVGRRLHDTKDRRVFNDIKATADGTWDFTLKGGQTMTVKGLPVGAAYTYTVTEAASGGYDVKGTLNGATTGGNPKVVTGKVTPESGPVPVTFTNTKKTPSPVTVNLKLQKEVTGSGFEWSGKTFTFLVTPDPTNPKDDPIGNKIVTVNSPDAVSIFGSDSVKFSAPGTYKYTVSEQTSDVPGISTDGTTYAVVVKVSEEYDASDIYTGKLKAEVTVNGETPKTPVAFTFTNKYNPDEITVPFNAKKVLEDGNLAEHTFTFEMKEGDTVLDTATNDADGNITFDALTFKEEDVGPHTYTISSSRIAF